MICVSQITKRFDGITAVDHVDASIKQGSVFGLIGTNGAGKSTFLRMVCGILRPDEGSITIDGQPVFENPAVKSTFFYISDDQYFFPGSTPLEMARYYSTVYPRFDTGRFSALMDSFSLDLVRIIHTFSKGMKKQLSILLAISSRTDYLFCDETFDGLDPVMRQAVKSLFAAEMDERGLTPVIASHNLRELEDICDHVGLLHKGGILLNRDLEEMKLGIHKIQCAFSQPVQPEEFPFTVLLSERRGSLLTMTVRGAREEILAQIQAKNPLFAEILPLSLEEIFISETEVAGYDIKKLLF